MPAKGRATLEDSMPTIRLHQPIEGKAVGETISVPAERADWYVAQGYATIDGSDDTGGQGELVTPPGADKDPTLAQNREAPDDEDGNPAVPTTEEPSVVWTEDNGAVQDFSGSPTRLFDPREHSVSEVKEHLRKHPQDVGRIHGLETGPGGKSRKSILTDGTGYGPGEIDDRSEPKPVDPKVVGPAEPSKDTLAGREPKVPNDPDPGDDATSQTPGDPKFNEPEEGTVIRNPATGTAF